MNSCEAAGIKLTEDFNKPGGREGAGYYHFAVREGVRDSAARAMLGDIIMGRDVRTNLDVLTSAHVNKVVIENAQPVRRRSATLPPRSFPNNPNALRISILILGCARLVKQTDIILLLPSFHKHWLPVDCCARFCGHVRVPW